MVHLVALLQAAQDANGVFHRRLPHVHLLEAALQRGVLLDVLAVLIQRGRAHKAQLTAGEQRLDHVARIHRRVAGGTGAHYGVQLVDERDDLPVGLLDLVQHGLQPLLELAAELRAGDHGTQIQRDQRLALEGLGHVARDDAPRQALNDRGLAHTRLTDEHRVVLGAAGQHLHHATDLRITPDDRVDLALARTRGQVGGVLRQRLELILRVLRGHGLAAAHGGEGLLERVEGGAALGQKLRGVVAALGNAGQQHIGGHELVSKLAREILCRTQRDLQVPVDARVRHVLPLRAGVRAN